MGRRQFRGISAGTLLHTGGREPPTGSGGAGPSPLRATAGAVRFPWRCRCAPGHRLTAAPAALRQPGIHRLTGALPRQRAPCRAP
ncbi:hypothetical protein BKA18_006707 [Streptomyces auratus]